MHSETLRPIEAGLTTDDLRSAATSTFRRVRRLDPAKSRPRIRLFCFPYGGGSPSIFQDWPPLLPIDCEVWAAHLPGRESRWSEQCFTRLEPLIEDLAAAVYPLLGFPAAFFGHSMGALVAFELSRYLCCHAGFEPVHLFVSGAQAPHLPLRERPLHVLPDEQFLNEVRKFRGIPDEILESSEFLRLILPTLRADFSVYENYRHWLGPPLNCPITAFAGNADSKVSFRDVAAWRRQTKSRFEIRALAGDHFFIHSARGALLKEVAAILWPSSAVKPPHA